MTGRKGRSDFCLITIKSTIVITAFTHLARSGNQVFWTDVKTLLEEEEGEEDWAYKGQLLWFRMSCFAMGCTKNEIICFVPGTHCVHCSIFKILTASISVRQGGRLSPNPKHLWLDWKGLRISPGTRRPCYTSPIKKLKLSKMNSTCSMKAWHRCVALLGPPGRLSLPHGPVSTREKCGN